MPIETIRDPEHGIVVHRVKGPLRGDEVVEAMARVYEDPAHDPSTPVLWDAREADFAQQGYASMDAMVRRSQELWPRMAGGRTALLTEGLTEYGFGRMAELLAESMPRELHVFRDENEALVWLRGPTGSEH